MLSNDREYDCWSASIASEGSEAGIWAIAAALFSVANATNRLAKNFGPDADLAAPLRALETLAAAVDNVGAVFSQREISQKDMH